MKLSRLISIPGRAALVCVVCLAVQSLASCGGRKAPTGGDAQARAALTVLGLQYGAFLGAHGGAAPPDDAAMRQFLESRLEELKTYNVASVDQLLTATRDGKPARFVCGKTIASADQPQYLWAAYEEEGAGGTRLASNTRGGVYELTAEEFAKQISPK